MVAGLTSVVMQTKEIAESSEQTRQSFSVPLAKGRTRTIAVRLLGRVVIWVTSLYCEPRRGLLVLDILLLNPSFQKASGDVSPETGSENNAAVDTTHSSISIHLPPALGSFPLAAHRWQNGVGSASTAAATVLKEIEGKFKKTFEIYIKDFDFVIWQVCRIFQGVDLSVR